MILCDARATQAVGEQLADRIRPGDVVGLSGDLGTGKTCFTRGLIGGLGFCGEVPSPSFGLVIPYTTPEVRLPIWHVDLYRLDRIADIEELGLDEARAGAVLVIEWVERMGSTLWPETLRLRLDVQGRGRRLTAVVPEAWEGRWPPR